MDRRLQPFHRGRPVTIEFEGEPVRAYEGEPLAVALFASGNPVLSRSVKYHRPRSFFCLDGHCSGCLMRVGGIPNVRSCQVAAGEGITCERQNAFPSAEFDVLAAVDWVFASGMDHHTLLARQPLLRPVLERMVRELGGLGLLPDEGAPTTTIDARKTEVLIIGGGPAGLGCAEALAARGRQVILVDEGELGGSLLAEPGGAAHATELADRARKAGTTLCRRSTAIGWFPEDGPGVTAVAQASGLLLISADAIVHATGTYAQNLLCEDNDRPGVLAARALGRLLHLHGVLPGKRIALVGPSAHADRLEAALHEIGVETLRAARAVRTSGSPWIESVELEADVTVECDLLVACVPSLAASDLARQQGAKVDGPDRAFAISTTDQGRTSLTGVHACGEVAGAKDAGEALAQGRALGAHL